ncbi:unnamed protein product [Amoebophrya sp. A25]|nr:unnamed protein product [Amoebophrya sp. A25]|eukprot:GSA25T00024319001.1
MVDQRTKGETKAVSSTVGRAALQRRTSSLADATTAAHKKGGHFVSAKPNKAVPLMSKCRILILDYYDSYTYNLVDLVQGLTGEEPVCVLHDRLFETAAKQLGSDTRDLEVKVGILETFLTRNFDGIILSPGPGSPEEYLYRSTCSHSTRKKIRTEEVGGGRFYINGERECEATPQTTTTQAVLDIAGKHHIPLLGVCLGQQILCVAHGVPVRKVEPAHGIVDKIQVVKQCTAASGSKYGNGYSLEKQKIPRANHEDKEEYSVEQELPQLFAHFPLTVNVVRYHSLAAKIGPDVSVEGLESSTTRQNIEVLATTSDGELLMAMKVRGKPQYGVQFHPESVLTEWGACILSNWINIVSIERNSRPQQKNPWWRGDKKDDARSVKNQNGQHAPEKTSVPALLRDPRDTAPQLFVQKMCIPQHFDVEQFFQRSVAASGDRDGMSNAKPSFWLDNVRGEQDGSGFSFMGGGKLVSRLQDLVQMDGKCDTNSTTPTSPFSSQSSEDEEYFNEEYFIHYYRSTGYVSVSKSSAYAVDGEPKSGVDPSDEQHESGRAGGRGVETQTIPLRTNETLLDWFSDFCERTSALEEPVIQSENMTTLPFDFRCGFVGYFGYGLRRETLDGYSKEDEIDTVVEKNHKAGSMNDDDSRPPAEAPEDHGGYPDAYWYYATHCIVLDHADQSLYLLSKDHPYPPGTLTRLVASSVDLPKHKFPSKAEATLPETSATKSKELQPEIRMQPLLNRHEYEAQVRACREHLLAGDSYELCFTTEWQSEESACSLADSSSGSDLSSNQTSSGQDNRDVFALYRGLRSRNPAPYGCYLEVPLPDAGVDHNESPKNKKVLHVLSSSPERFLKVDRLGWAEMKPIKGTVRRGDTVEEDEALRTWLQSDVKNRAENLMIVDLVRHDLRKICHGGSVHCPNLMHVESYKTVHQLVSTVRGKLKNLKNREVFEKPKSKLEKSAVQIEDDAKQEHVDLFGCIQGSFPPGSMTGAPKKRSCELLDRLEKSERGIYSGALGFLGLGHTCELSVVIRTLFVESEIDVTNNSSRSISKVRLNAGGAITVLSKPSEEWDEMLLKCKAPLQVLSGKNSHVDVTRSAPSLKNRGAQSTRDSKSDDVPTANGAGIDAGDEGIRASNGCCKQPRQDDAVETSCKARTRQESRSVVASPSCIATSPAVLTTMKSCVCGSYSLDEPRLVVVIPFLADHLERLRSSCLTILGASLPPGLLTVANLRDAVRTKFSELQTRTATEKPRLGSFRIRCEIARNEGSSSGVDFSVTVAASMSETDCARDAACAAGIPLQVRNVEAIETRLEEDMLAPLVNSSDGGALCKDSHSPFILSACVDPEASATDSLAAHHKTSERSLYDRSLERVKETVLEPENSDAAHATFASSLLWNLRGEITELHIANFAVEIVSDLDNYGGGHRSVWITPPLRSGLLPGIVRNRLIKLGLIQERVLTLPQLRELVLVRKSRCIGFNALRGVFAVELSFPHVKAAAKSIGKLDT